MTLLSIHELSKRFGALQVVDRLSLEVTEGEILGVVGPNGAGKTTLFNLITGFLSPNAGLVKFNDRNITRKAVHVRCLYGMARTFQMPQLFSDMSVMQNVILGGVPRSLFSLRGVGFANELETQAGKILDMIGLPLVSEVRAAELPYGHQQKLEIGRALMTNPRLLLLDEPAAGMTDAEAGTIAELIRAVQKMGCTVVIVDHNMRLIMNVCERIVVMNFGKIIADGSPTRIRSDPNVIAAYLGND